MGSAFDKEEISIKTIGSAITNPKIQGITSFNFLDFRGVTTFHKSESVVNIELSK
jgi:hypothetical protein